jgi:hypothetical protein
MRQIVSIALITTLLTPIISASAAEPLIINFYGVKEGDYIKFNFYFNDNKRYDGTVHLTIVDKVGTVLYEDTFYVTAKDYQGSSFYSYYEWYVSFDKIKKGIGSYGYGTAYLTFLMPDGTKLEYSDTVEIPTLSEEEIIAMYEERYLSTSKEINKTLKIYPLEVTLKRIGYFTHLKYDTWGDEVTRFRVDIQVKNVGNNEHSFWYYDAAVVIGSKQYNVLLFESKFDGSSIRPNVIREGYLLFDIPETELRGIGYIDVGKILFGVESYIFNINFTTMSPIEEGKIVEKVHNGKRAAMLTLENYTDAKIRKIHLHAVYDKGTAKIITAKTKDFSRERLNEREVILTANSTLGFGSIVKLAVIAKGDVEYYVYDEQGRTLTSGMLIGHNR